MRESIALFTGCNSAFDTELISAIGAEGYTTYVLGGADGVSAAIPLPEQAEEACAQIKAQAGRIDLYVEVADERGEEDRFTVTQGVREDVIQELFQANVLDVMRRLEIFLPLIEEGSMKRLCFFSSRQATMSGSTLTHGFGYAMGKGALHNFLQGARNKLAPLGYTMRLYDPLHGQVAPAASAAGAAHLFTRARAVDTGNPRRDDEKRLKLRDALGREQAW